MGSEHVSVMDLGARADRAAFLGIVRGCVAREADLFDQLEVKRSQCIP